MRASPIIILSLLSAFVIGENKCRTTTKDNCFDNIGQLCGDDVAGNVIRDGDDICCYVRVDGSESGVVKCDASGVFIAVACNSGFTCKINFDTCLHRCS